MWIRPTNIQMHQRKMLIVFKKWAFLLPCRCTKTLRTCLQRNFYWTQVRLLPCLVTPSVRQWQCTDVIKILSHLNIIQVCINYFLRIRRSARIKHVISNQQNRHPLSQLPHNLLLLLLPSPPANLPKNYANKVPRWYSVMWVPNSSALLLTPLQHHYLQ